MADPRDNVSVLGFHPSPITVLGDATLAYDATQPNGHALAGFGAVYWVGDLQMGLVTAGILVEGQLVAVEADGKATVLVDRFLVFQEGATGGTVVGNTLIGDAAAGYVTDAPMTGRGARVVSAGSGQFTEVIAHL